MSFLNVGPAPLSSSLDHAFVEKECSHCGTLFRATQSEKYCCRGCAAVARILDSTQSRSLFETLNAIRPFFPQNRGNAKTLNLVLHGQSEKLYLDNRTFWVQCPELECPSCVWLLDQVPRFEKSLESIQSHSELGLTRVTLSEGSSLNDGLTSLQNYGLSTKPIRLEEVAALTNAKSDASALVRLGISAALAGNVMSFALATYLGLTGSLATVFGWISWVMAGLSLTYGAAPMWRSAWRALKVQSIGFDLPILVAILAAFVLSSWNLLNGNAQDIYFDALTMLVFLLLLSRWVLARYKNQQLTALASHVPWALENYRLVPDLLTVGLKDISLIKKQLEDFRIATATSLEINQCVWLQAGQTIPADGEVLVGHGEVDHALLTGESEPQLLKPLSRVFAGGTLVSGELVFRVHKAPRFSRVPTLLKAARELSQQPIEFLHPRWGVMFTLVSSFAAITTAVWVTYTSASGVAAGLAEGFQRALTILVVTCPCALAFAIPLAQRIVAARLLDHGVLVRDLGAFDFFANAKTIWFDKTGTLTSGVIQVVRERLYTSREFIGQVIHLLEGTSEHPIALALRRQFERSDYPGLQASSLQVLPDGTRELRSALGLFRLARQVPQIAEKGTLQYRLQQDETVIGEFTLRDSVRIEARKVLEALRDRLHLETRIVSGDREEVVANAAQDLGVKIHHSACTPEGKLAIITNSADSVLVGDGANDALALAACPASVAMYGALEASIGSSKAVLLKPGLSGLVTLFASARFSRKLSKRLLWISVAYNLLAAGLASAGLLAPWMAAVLMPLSSLTLLLVAKSSINQWSLQQRGPA